MTLEQAAAALRLSNRRFHAALTDWEKGVASFQRVDDAEFECEMAQRAFIEAGGCDAAVFAILDEE
jgi:hypothetical protein